MPHTQTSRLRAREHDLYLSGLVEGSRALTKSAVDNARTRGLSVRETLTQVIIPAQRSLGEMWARGEISVTEEHRATEITIDILGYLRQFIAPRPALDRRAVATVIQGDLHLLGARIVADMFFEDGWEVDFLGAGTPTADIINHISKFGAHVVLLSASAQQFIQPLQQLAALLRKSFPDIVIIAGGQAFAAKSLTAKGIGVDYIAESFEDAIPQARKRLGIAGGASSLNQLLGVVGQKIKLHRTARGISQQELARLAQLDRAYISSLENGKKNISIGTMLRIAEALDTEVKALID